MATTVRISANPLQHVLKPFRALVIVTGAPEGANVKATLVQTSGVLPFWGPETQSQLAPATGGLVFTFKEVTLRGPTQATLSATVEDDKGTFYPIAVEDIEVVEDLEDA
jgi:hypothetical protein